MEQERERILKKLQIQKKQIEEVKKKYNKKYEKISSKTKKK